MVLGQLAKEGLNPVEWGGETEVVRTSATTGQGIKELIEMLDYQSELLAAQDRSDGPGARQRHREPRMDEGLGPVATVLVQDGTLRPGDVLLCGRDLRPHPPAAQRPRRSAAARPPPSMPVVVSGLSGHARRRRQGLPGGGHRPRQADLRGPRRARPRRRNWRRKNAVSLENLLDTIKQEDMKEVRLIIKADVAGSVETLAKTVVGEQQRRGADPRDPRGGRPDHRERRRTGGCLQGGHHRLQRGAGRVGPHAWPSSGASRCGSTA